MGDGQTPCRIKGNLIFGAQFASRVLTEGHQSRAPSWQAAEGSAASPQAGEKVGYQEIALFTDGGYVGDGGEVGGSMLGKRVGVNAGMGAQLRGTKVFRSSFDPCSKNDLSTDPELKVMEGDLTLRAHGYLTAEVDNG